MVTKSQALASRDAEREAAEAPPRHEKGRQPDWDLRYLNKRTDEKAQVGVGWDNEDGSIRVKLNPRVMLIGEPDCILTLFRKKNKGAYPGSQQETSDDKPF